MIDRRARMIVDQLSERDRIIITRRFGLDGHAPITRRQLAAVLDTSSLHCARFERGAICEALRLARLSSDANC